MGQGRVLLSLLALLALTSCSKKAADPSAQARAAAADVPELTMTGMHVQSYGPTGLDWEMESPSGEIFTRRNIMHVKEMAVALFENGNRSTVVTADQGFMATGETPQKRLMKDPAFHNRPMADGDILVDGDVVVISTDGSKLYTDWAHYSKKSNLIVSTAPVRVVRQDSTTKGLGLEATADLTRVKIFNQTLVIHDRSEQKAP